MKYLKTIVDRAESFIEDDRKAYGNEPTSGRALGEYPDFEQWVRDKIAELKKRGGKNA